MRSVSAVFLYITNFALYVEVFMLHSSFCRIFMYSLVYLCPGKATKPAGDKASWSVAILAQVSRYCILLLSDGEASLSGNEFGGRPSFLRSALQHLTAAVVSTWSVLDLRLLRSTLAFIGEGIVGICLCQFVKQFWICS